MTIFQAFLIALLVLFFTVGEAWFAYPMINQPLVICSLVGLILGDLHTGVVSGATLQMIFLGTMQIGGTVPADATLGSVIGTAFAISMGQSTEVALTFAVPVSMLGSFLIMFAYMSRGFFNPLVEKLVNKGDRKGLERLYIALAFIPEIPRVIILFIALAFGSGFASAAIDYVPEFIIEGMDYATNLMPAVGIALLLKMMWSKQYGVYYALGIILVSFFALQVIGVAAVGVVLAVILFLESKNRGMESVAIQTTQGDVEEDFFND